MDNILGALNIENEAFQKAQLFSWVFFPTWIILAIVQAVCFVLSNGRFHPLTKILEGCDNSDEGKYLNSIITITSHNYSTLYSLINVKIRLLILKKKSTLYAHFHPPRLLIS